MIVITGIAYKREGLLYVSEAETEEAAIAELAEKLNMKVVKTVDALYLLDKSCDHTDFLDGVPSREGWWVASGVVENGFCGDAVVW